MEDLLYLSPKPERVQLQDRERPVNDSEERREALEPEGVGAAVEETVAGRVQTCGVACGDYIILVT